MRRGARGTPVPSNPSSSSSIASVPAQVWTGSIDDLVVKSPPMTTEVTTATAKPAKTRRVTYDRYLKGPVPWDWLLAAANCGGSALVVGLVVWREHGMNPDLPAVISSTKTGEFCVDRKTIYRALVALENAGLIEVTRAHGRAARVRVKDVRGDAPCAVAP